MPLIAPRNMIFLREINSFSRFSSNQLFLFVWFFTWNHFSSMKPTHFSFFRVTYEHGFFSWNQLNYRFFVKLTYFHGFFFQPAFKKKPLPAKTSKKSSSDEDRKSSKKSSDKRKNQEKRREDRLKQVKFWDFWIFFAKTLFFFLFSE